MHDVDPLAQALSARPGELRFFRAPARVNLMGDHTDYNDGFVLPLAVDRECLVAARPRSDGRVVLRSVDFGETAELAADGSDPLDGVGSPWARLAAAVLGVLADGGRPASGTDLAVASTVPVGSGLSSSAAFGVALATALCDEAGHEVPPVEIALTAQEAEQRATGVRCGIMDQLASAAGVEGHALLLDARVLSYEPVPLPDDLAVLVAHSGVARSLSDTPYAERRAACETAARRRGLVALREATLDDIDGDPLVRHVVTENTRVRATAVALVSRDRHALGELFAASHASLRDDFAATVPELDALVETLVDAGAVGARPTGAGWGGCAVALVPTDRVEAVAAAVADREHWVCRAVAGAGPFEP